MLNLIVCKRVPRKIENDSGSNLVGESFFRWPKDESKNRIKWELLSLDR